MKEINISSMIIKKRKEKGITQEELASYMGISKAAISKWETSQSYPDITLLPLLAAYFNISVDELIGYEPQMVKEDIKKLYHSLCIEFTKQPFTLVREKCQAIIKKYYSCYPLLFQIGVLLINHSLLANTREETFEVYEETRKLSYRITVECNDVDLAKMAKSLNAYCNLLLNNPIEAIELLGETIQPRISKDIILAQAYQMTGQIDKAKATIQINMYKNIIGSVGAYPNLLILYADNETKFREYYESFLGLDETFGIRKMHPGVVLPVLLTAIQGYLIQENFDKAMKSLEDYVDLVITSKYPLKLEGNKIFDQIDSWLLDFDLGVLPPRNDKTIKDSILKAIIENPMINVLKENKQYNNQYNKLVTKLERFLKE